MNLEGLEQLARSYPATAIEVPESSSDLHPFEVRNVHPDLPGKVRRQFDDGYFDDATFTAFKFIEQEVKRLSGLRRLTGNALMMKAFDENEPLLAVNGRATDSDRDEQFGYRYMFAGAQSGIRNPRGHEVDIPDDPDTCLDHLALASVLLRKLDAAGLR
ncbi:TIGR02391 family protein [Microbacterium sp. MEC084]|uniref:TIGR02391 family protein n=1 Tax=Microbacterium sp. MEC084 TaxID=1963027 RepID=UPI0010703362|nr:TIGR02391 family protein [Microbacterium sp. MEC084]MCD1268543.1 TIGR02391 family protein [Microbacterium sp. MEC084]